MTTTRRAVLALAAAALAAPGGAAAAPASRLLSPRWAEFGAGGDPEAGPWAEFLGRWRRPGADGVARVDYAGAKAAGALGPLRDWIGAMEGVEPAALSRPAAFAFWCNLYNAETVALILEAWPVGSIRDIGGSLFSPGPWREARLTVGGAALSLDDVEHGILRPVWGDARVHYAVNCAALGCPDLGAAPWRAEGLDAALDEAARAFVNHPRGAEVEGGRLVVSKIYDWFEEDFGGTDAGVIAHLRAHAEPPLAAALEGVTRIAGSEYDWSINAA